MGYYGRRFVARTQTIRGEPLNIHADIAAPPPFASLTDAAFSFLFHVRDNRILYANVAARRGACSATRRIAW